MAGRYLLWVHFTTACQRRRPNSHGVEAAVSARHDHSADMFVGTGGFASKSGATAFLPSDLEGFCRQRRGPAGRFF